MTEKPKNLFDAIDAATAAPSSPPTRRRPRKFEEQPAECTTHDDGSEVCSVDKIICPSCGSESIHQVGVRALFGQGAYEDAALMRSTRADAHSSGVSEERRENSVMRRRDVVLIYFECEECEDLICDWMLRIMQHKGSTYLDWVTNDKVWAPQKHV